MMVIIMITIIKDSIQHNALAPPYEFDDEEITALQQEGGMERSMIEVGIKMLIMMMMMMMIFMIFMMMLGC